MIVQHELPKFILPISSASSVSDVQKCQHDQGPSTVYLRHKPDAGEESTVIWDMGRLLVTFVTSGTDYKMTNSDSLPIGICSIQYYTKHTNQI